MVAYNRAFTLVELAIVIVIIGLLVGGVLTGQELIKQAKIRGFVKQIEDVKTATQTFYSKYNNLPGDLPAAKSMQFLVYNGGGNGDGQLCSHAVCANGLTGISDAEFVWLHLTLAKMINVTKANGDPFLATTNSGITRYYARFRGDKGGENNYNMSGVMMLLTGDFAKVYHGMSWGSDIAVNAINLTTVTTNGNQVNGAFTPEETRMLDEKMDDGISTTGTLLGPYGSTTSGASCSTNGVYANNDKDAVCRILYQLGL